MYMGWVLCTYMLIVYMVPYTCILIVHMGAMDMYIDCVYRCYIHVY